MRNSGETAVLMLDGEELVGAKQNRIVNLTILVPRQPETIIPVSCIEADRWGYSRPNFTAAGRVLDRKFLRAVCNATADRFPAVGLGEEFRFDTEEIGGGALALQGDLVHLFAYPRRPNDRRSDDRRTERKAAS